jgi:hypothetical protein
MATAEGKSRRSFTLPDEIWEAFDAQVAIEQRPVPDLLSDRLLHECATQPPADQDVAQLALDVHGLREDLKALVGLLERWMQAQAPAPPATEALMTPKQALGNWYASNATQVIQEADIPTSVRYADMPPSGLLARLWRWLMYRPGGSH